MGLFSRSTADKSFHWTELTSENQLNECLAGKDVIFIFKHSTRCSISVMAKSRFEREWITPDFPFRLLYLDLLNYRSVSDKIEALTDVQHQSPQLIVIHSGKIVYQQSHNAISAKESIKAITL